MNTNYDDHGIANGRLLGETLGKDWAVSAEDGPAIWAERSCRETQVPVRHF